MSIDQLPEAPKPAQGTLPGGHCTGPHPTDSLSGAGLGPLLAGLEVPCATGPPAQWSLSQSAPEPAASTAALSAGLSPSHCTDPGSCAFPAHPSGFSGEEMCPVSEPGNKPAPTCSAPDVTPELMGPAAASPQPPSRAPGKEGVPWVPWERPCTALAPSPCADSPHCLGSSCSMRARCRQTRTATARRGEGPGCSDMGGRCHRSLSPPS